MLFYNPENRTEKLDELEAWLETQDPDQRYNYGSICHCALAEFHKQRGTVYSVALNSHYDTFSTFEVIAERAADWCSEITGHQDGHTFGAMLKTLQSLRSELNA